MSIRLLADVLDNFTRGGSEKLVMVAMADWANDQGGSLFPSMAAIGRRACISRSQAQRIVHGLCADGYLKVVANAMGGKPGITPQYRIVVERLRGSTDAAPTGSTHATGSVRATGRTHAADGSHPCGRGVAPMRPNPSLPVINHQDQERVRSAPRTSGSGTRLSEDWQLPDEQRAWVKTDRPEWTDTQIERVAIDFRDYWIAKAGAAARKADWFATWRTWVRRQEGFEGKGVSKGGDNGGGSWMRTPESVEAEAKRVGANTMGCSKDEAVQRVIAKKEAQGFDAYGRPLSVRDRKEVERKRQHQAMYGSLLNPDGTFRSEVPELRERDITGEAMRVS